ncbi:unnamed protein product [Amoebophrya sp. A25]|nr:unnamed protein product [Amoebophrya sp. A25]|eukprot:GSA25T00002199001.1
MFPMSTYPTAQAVSEESPAPPAAAQVDMSTQILEYMVSSTRKLAADAHTVLEDFNPTLATSVDLLTQHRLVELVARGLDTLIQVLVLANKQPAYTRRTSSTTQVSIANAVAEDGPRNSERTSTHQEESATISASGAETSDASPEKQSPEGGKSKEDIKKEGDRTTRRSKRKTSTSVQGVNEGQDVVATAASPGGPTQDLQEFVEGITSAMNALHVDIFGGEGDAGRASQSPPRPSQSSRKSKTKIETSSSTRADGVAGGPLARVPDDGEEEKSGEQEQDEEDVAGDGGVELTDADAVDLCRVFVDLGGVFPKFSQVLSLRTDIVRNPKILAAMRMAHEQCKSRAVTEIAKHLSKEGIGNSFFREFRLSKRGVKAGSICQVTRFFEQPGRNYRSSPGKKNKTSRSTRTSPDIKRISRMSEKSPSPNTKSEQGTFDSDAFSPAARSTRGSQRPVNPAALAEFDSENKMTDPMPSATSSAAEDDGLIAAISSPSASPTSPKTRELILSSPSPDQKEGSPSRSKNKRRFTTSDTHGENIQKDRTPFGVVKTSFSDDERLFAIDFRLLREETQFVKLAERMYIVRGADVAKVQESVHLLLSMEKQFLAEFNMDWERRNLHLGRRTVAKVMPDLTQDWYIRWADKVLPHLLEYHHVRFFGAIDGATDAIQARSPGSADEEASTVMPGMMSGLGGAAEGMASGDSAARAQSATMAHGTFGGVRGLDVMASIMLMNETSRGSKQQYERVKRSLEKMKIKVPRVLDEFCTKRVLCMEWAPGTSFKELLDRSLEDLKWRESGRDSSVDNASLTRNASTGVASPGQQEEATEVENDEDHLGSELANPSNAGLILAVTFFSILVPLFGRMLMHEGICHADPHPGNFKLSGRNLWILDWGTILEVPVRKRRLFSRLVLNNFRRQKFILQGAINEHKDDNTADGGEQTSGASASAAPDKQQFPSSGPTGAGCKENVKAMLAELRKSMANDMRSLMPNPERAAELSDEYLEQAACALFDPNIQEADRKMGVMRNRDPNATLQGEDLSELLAPPLSQVVRMVAILVGILSQLEEMFAKELEKSNAKRGTDGGSAAEPRATKSGESSATTTDSSPPSSAPRQLWLPELWAPLAEEAIRKMDEDAAAKEAEEYR